MCSFTIFCACALVILPSFGRNGTRSNNSFIDNRTNSVEYVLDQTTLPSKDLRLRHGDESQRENSVSYSEVSQDEVFPKATYFLHELARGNGYWNGNISSPRQTTKDSVPIRQRLGRDLSESLCGPASYPDCKHAEKNIPKVFKVVETLESEGKLWETWFKGAEEHHRQSLRNHTCAKDSSTLTKYEMQVIDKSSNIATRATGFVAKKPVSTLLQSFGLANMAEDLDKALEGRWIYRADKWMSKFPRPQEFGHALSRAQGLYSEIGCGPRKMEASSHRYVHVETRGKGLCGTFPRCSCAAKCFLSRFEPLNARLSSCMVGRLLQKKTFKVCHDDQ